MKNLRTFSLPAITTILIFSGLLGISSNSIADVPQEINYQGRLLDSQGEPVSGELGMAVRLFDSETEGNLLYEEELGLIVIDSGVYRFEFGGAGIAEALNSPETWLEVEIDGEPILPRSRLLTVPFALRASKADEVANKNAETLNGQPSSFFVPPGIISAYGGSSDPPGWMICDGRMLSVESHPELFAAIGNTYGGDGVTTFQIPDSRGMVLRGTGSQLVNTREKVGPALGTVQEDQMQRITGAAGAQRIGTPSSRFSQGALSVSNHSERAGSSGASGAGNRFNFDSSNSPNARTSATTSGETRVSSLGVNFIIKY